MQYKMGTCLDVLVCPHFFYFVSIAEQPTVMKLLMNALELMCISLLLLLTNHFSSQVFLYSGMNFQHQQNRLQCVQLHSW